MTSNRLRSRSGCLTCRQRHLKCDEARPVCWRCKIGSRECVLPPSSLPPRTPSYRRRESSADGKQRPTVGNDEQQGPTGSPEGSLAEIDWTHIDPAVSNGLDGDNQSPSASSRGMSTAQTDTHVSFRSPPKTVNFTISSIISPTIQDVPLPQSVVSPGHDPSGPHAVPSPYNPAVIDLQNIYRSPRGTGIAESALLSPDSAETTEFLIQHYARTCGRWFTMADAGRHFTTTVPHLARTSQILMKAICALAARHLSGTSGYDSSLAERYHEECISLLIPALNDPNVTADETMLAALVILRLYEHLQFSDLFQGHHLLGTSAFVRSVMGNTVPDCSHGLQEASFWGYFRQCLYVACVNCEPLKFDISIYQIEMKLSTPCTATLPTTEEESKWCKWITWILAEVVEFCFGPQGPLMTLEEAQSSWRELVSKVDMWESNKPSSFQAIAFLDRDPEKHRLFPLRWFGNEWHALANMYSITARILLDVHDPLMRNISMGQFGFRRARKDLELKVLNSARALCGICLANPGNVPTIITLSHAIFSFASFLEDVEERWMLIGMLQSSEREESWPTKWIVKALLEEWDMTASTLEAG
ncbi:hypothetical protein LTR23_000067 [Exophiala sp. CCFEE 6169]|nr:hypothetical protein LTR23_000067 [Chaetothyriales sp. CCFEE 6169]